MSVLQCYSVFDKAVSAFMPPFYVRTKGEAIRSFIDAVNDPQRPFLAHAGDYTLYQCGEFEDGTGIFSSREPERIITAHEVLKKDE